MKSLARGYIWWPGMDRDLETMVKHCQVCQLHRHNPPLAQVHPCHWPNRPWSRVHVDYAGPFMGKMFLLIIDSHSKWLDIHITSSSNSVVTIQKLRQTFSTMGLPKVLVSDNGPSFASQILTHSCPRMVLSTDE